MNIYKSNEYLSLLEQSFNNTINIDELKNKSVLITGASGLIGSNIIDVLLMCNIKNNFNIKIYASGRNIIKLSERFYKFKNDIHFLEYDVNSKPNFNINFDYIIHAASNANPASYNNDPVGTITSNVFGIKYLLDYAVNHKCKRVLYISSGEIYGIGDESVKSYAENYCGYIDSTNPRSCYPNSKRLAETLCVSYIKQYGIESVIVRPCHIYGPNYTESDNRVSASFFRDVMDNKDIVLKSEGKQLRNYCFVLDATTAILTVLINGKNGEAYNIANKNSIVTIAEFANKIAANTNRKVIFEIPDEEDIKQRTFINKQVLNANKIEELGWKPKYNIDDGINKTIEILKEESV